MSGRPNTLVGVKQIAFVLGVSVDATPRAMCTGLKIEPSVFEDSYKDDTGAGSFFRALTFKVIWQGRRNEEIAIILA